METAVVTSKSTLAIAGMGLLGVRKAGAALLGTKFGELANKDSVGDLLLGQGQSQELVYQGLRDHDKQVDKPNNSKAFEPEA